MAKGDYKFRELRNSATGEIEQNPIEAARLESIKAKTQAELDLGDIARNKEGKANIGLQNVQSIGLTDYSPDEDFSTGATKEAGPNSLDVLQDEQQTFTSKLVNTVTDGIASGLIGVVEPITQGVSFILGGAETEAGLAVKSFTDILKEDMGNALEVHEKALSPNAGIGESFWRWSTANSIIDSATQFIIMGKISAGALSKIGGFMYKSGATAEAVLGSGKMARGIQKTMGEAGRLLSKDVYAGFTNRVSSKSLATAFMSNALEGVVMGKQMETDMRNRYQDILTDHRTDPETRAIILDNIDTATAKLQVYNTALVFNDIAGFSRLTSSLSAKAAKKSAVAKLVKDYPLLSVAEYLEESGQGILQARQTLNADKYIQKDYEKAQIKDTQVDRSLEEFAAKGDHTAKEIRAAKEMSVLNRANPEAVLEYHEQAAKSMIDFITDYAATTDNIVEGLSGLVGGGPQFAMIRAIEFGTGGRAGRKKAAENLKSYEETLLDKLTAGEVAKASTNSVLDKMKDDLATVFQGEDTVDDLNLVDVVTDYSMANDIIDGIENGHVEETSELLSDHRDEAAENLRNGEINQDQYNSEMRRNKNATAILEKYKNHGTYTNGSKQLSKARKIEALKAVFSLEENMDVLRKTWGSSSTVDDQNDTPPSPPDGITYDTTDSQGNPITLSSENEEDREPLLKNLIADEKAAQDAYNKQKDTLNYISKMKPSPGVTKADIEAMKTSAASTMMEQKLKLEGLIDNIKEVKTLINSTTAAAQQQSASPLREATPSTPDPNQATADLKELGTLREEFDTAALDYEDIKKQVEDGSLEEDSPEVVDALEQQNAAKKKLDEFKATHQQLPSSENDAENSIGETAEATEAMNSNPNDDTEPGSKSVYESLEEAERVLKKEGATEEELDRERELWFTDAQKVEKAEEEEEKLRVLKLEADAQNNKSSWVHMSIAELQGQLKSGNLSEADIIAVSLVIQDKEAEMLNSLNDLESRTEIKVGVEARVKKEQDVLDRLNKRIEAKESSRDALQEVIKTKGKGAKTAKSKAARESELAKRESELDILNSIKRSLEESVRRTVSDGESILELYDEQIDKIVFGLVATMSEQTIKDSIKTTKEGLSDDLKAEFDAIAERAISLVNTMNIMLRANISTEYQFHKFLKHQLEISPDQSKETKERLSKELKAAYLMILNGDDTVSKDVTDRVKRLRKEAMLKNGSVDFNEYHAIKGAIATLKSKGNSVRRFMTKKGKAHDSYNRALGLVQSFVKGRVQYLENEGLKETKEYKTLTDESKTIEDKADYVLSTSEAGGSILPTSYSEALDVTGTEVQKGIEGLEAEITELRGTQELIDAAALVKMEDSLKSQLRAAARNKDSQALPRFIKSIKSLQDSSTNKEHEAIYKDIIELAKDVKKVKVKKKKSQPKKKTPTEDGTGPDNKGAEVPGSDVDKVGDEKTEEVDAEDLEEEEEADFVPPVDNESEETSWADKLNNGETVPGIRVATPEEIAAAGDLFEARAKSAQEMLASYKERSDEFQVSEQDSKVILEASGNSLREATPGTPDPIVPEQDNIASRLLHDIKLLIEIQKLRYGRPPTRDSVLDALLVITKVEQSEGSRFIEKVLDSVYGLKVDTQIQQLTPQSTVNPTVIETVEDAGQVESSADNSIKRTTATLSKTAMSIAWDTAAGDYRLVSEGARLQLVVDDSDDSIVNLLPGTETLGKFKEFRDSIRAEQADYDKEGKGEKVAPALVQFLDERFDDVNITPIRVKVFNGIAPDGSEVWTQVGNVHTPFFFEEYREDDDILVRKKADEQKKVVEEIRAHIWKKKIVTATVSGRESNITVTDNVIAGVAVRKKVIEERHRIGKDKDKKYELVSAKSVFGGDKEVVLGFMGTEGTISGKTVDRLPKHAEIAFNKNIKPGTPLSIFRVENTDKWIAEPLIAKKIESYMFKDAVMPLEGALGKKNAKRSAARFSPYVLRQQLKSAVDVSHTRDEEVTSYKDVKFNITLDRLPKTADGETVREWDIKEGRKWVVSMHLGYKEVRVEMISIPTRDKNNTVSWEHKPLRTIVTDHSKAKGLNVSEGTPQDLYAITSAIYSKGSNSNASSLPYFNFDSDKLYGNRETSEYDGYSEKTILRRGKEVTIKAAKRSSKKYSDYMLENTETAVRRGKALQELTKNEETGDPGIISYTLNTRVTFELDEKPSKLVKDVTGKGAQTKPIIVPDTTKPKPKPKPKKGGENKNVVKPEIKPEADLQSREKLEKTIEAVKTKVNRAASIREIFKKHKETKKVFELVAVKLLNLSKAEAKAESKEVLKANILRKLGVNPALINSASATKAIDEWIGQLFAIGEKAHLQLESHANSVLREATPGTPAPNGSTPKSFSDSFDIQITEFNIFDDDNSTEEAFEAMFESAESEDANSLFAEIQQEIIDAHDVKLSDELIIQRIVDSEGEPIPEVSTTEKTVEEINEERKDNAVQYATGVMKRYGHDSVKELNLKYINILSKFRKKYDHNRGADGKFKLNSTELVMMRQAITTIAARHVQSVEDRSTLTRLTKEEFDRDIEATLEELNVFISITTDSVLLEKAIQYRTILTTFNKSGQTEDGITNFSKQSLLDSGVATAVDRTGFEFRQSDAEGWQVAAIQRNPLDGASKAIRSLLNSFGSYTVNAEGKVEPRLGLTGQPLSNPDAYITLMGFFADSSHTFTFDEKMKNLEIKIDNMSINPEANANKWFMRDVREALLHADVQTQREFNKVMNKILQTYSTVDTYKAKNGTKLFLSNPNYSTAFGKLMSSMRVNIDSAIDTDSFSLTLKRVATVELENAGKSKLPHSHTVDTMFDILEPVLQGEVDVDEFVKGYSAQDLARISNFVRGMYTTLGDIGFEDNNPLRVGKWAGRRRVDFYQETADKFILNQNGKEFKASLRKLLVASNMKSSTAIMEYMAALGIDPTSSGAALFAEYAVDNEFISKVELAGNKTKGNFRVSNLMTLLPGDIKALLSNSDKPITPVIRALTAWIAENTDNTIESSMTIISNKTKAYKSEKAQTKRLSNITEVTPLSVKFKALESIESRNNLKEDAFAGKSPMLSFLDTHEQGTDEGEFDRIFKFKSVTNPGLLPTKYSDVNKSDDSKKNALAVLGAYFASIEMATTTRSINKGSWSFGKRGFRQKKFRIGDKSYLLLVRGSTHTTNAFSDSDNSLRVESFDFDSVELVDGAPSIKEDYLNFYTDSTVLAEVNRMLAHINSSDFKSASHESYTDMEGNKNVNPELSFNFESLNETNDKGQTLYDILVESGIKGPLSTLQGLGEITTLTTDAARLQLSESVDTYIDYLVSVGILEYSGGYYSLGKSVENIADFKVWETNVTGAEDLNIIHKERGDLTAKSTPAEILDSIASMFSDVDMTRHQIANILPHVVTSAQSNDMAVAIAELKTKGKKYTQETLFDLLGLGIDFSQFKEYVRLTKQAELGMPYVYEGNKLKRVTGGGMSAQLRAAIDKFNSYREAEDTEEIIAAREKAADDLFEAEKIEETLNEDADFKDLQEQAAAELLKDIRTATKESKKKGSPTKFVVPSLLTPAEARAFANGAAKPRGNRKVLNMSTVKASLLHKAFSTGFFQASMQQLIQGDIAYTYKESKKSADTIGERNSNNVRATLVNYSKREKVEVTPFTQIAEGQDIIVLQTKESVRVSPVYNGKNGYADIGKQDTMDAAVLITARARLTDLVLESYLTEEEALDALKVLDPIKGESMTLAEFRAAHGDRAANIIISSTRKPVSGSMHEMENTKGDKIRMGSFVKMGESVLLRSLVGYNLSAKGVKQLTVMEEMERELNTVNGVLTPPGPNYKTVRLAPPTAHKKGAATAELDIDNVRILKSGKLSKKDRTTAVNSTTTIPRHSWGEQNVVKFKEGKRTKDSYQPKDIVMSMLNRNGKATSAVHPRTGAKITNVKKAWDKVQTELGKLAMENMQRLVASEDEQTALEIMEGVYDSPEALEKAVTEHSLSKGDDSYLRNLIISSMKVSNDQPLDPNDPIVQFLELDATGKRFRNPIMLSDFMLLYSDYIRAAFEKVSSKTRRNGFSLPLMSDESVDLGEAGVEGGSDILLTDKFYGQNKNDIPEKPSPQTVKKRAQVLMRSKFEYIDPVTGNRKQFNARDHVKTVDGRRVVDTSSIPDAALQHFTYRTPTQTHAMTSPVEVIGFLPEVMATSVIAPMEFISLMGSDFDIDKLFGMSYNMAMIGGKLQIIKESHVKTFPRLKKAYLENVELDLLIAVLTDESMLKDHMVQDLDTSASFEGLAELLDTAKGNSRFSNSSPLSLTHGEAKRNNAVGAAESIGVYALLERVFSQTRLLEVPTGDLSLGSKAIRFFGQEGNSLFQRERTDSTKIKWDEEVLGNISSMVSLSVDDESLQLLGRLGVENRGFNDTVPALLMVGLSAKSAIMLHNIEGKLDPLAVYNKRAKEEGLPIAYTKGEKPSSGESVEITSDSFNMGNMTESQFQARLERYLKVMLKSKGEGDVQDLSQDELKDIIALRLFKNAATKSFGETLGSVRWAHNLDSKGIPRNIATVLRTAKESNTIYAAEWDSYFSKNPIMQNAKDQVNYHAKTLTYLYNRRPHFAKVVEALGESDIDVDMTRIATAYRTAIFRELKPDVYSVINRLNSLRNGNAEARDFVANNAFLSRAAVTNSTITYNASERISQQDVVNGLAAIKNSGVIAGFDMRVFYEDLVSLGLSDGTFANSYGRSFARFIGAREYERALARAGIGREREVDPNLIAVEIALRNIEEVVEVKEGETPETDIYKTTTQNEAGEYFSELRYLRKKNGIVMNDKLGNPIWESIPITEEYATVFEKKSNVTRLVGTTRLIEKTSMLDRVFSNSRDTGVKLFLKNILKSLPVRQGDGHRVTLRPDGTVSSVILNVKPEIGTPADSVSKFRRSVVHEGIHVAVQGAVRAFQEGTLSEFSKNLGAFPKKKHRLLQETLQGIEDARHEAMNKFNEITMEEFDRDSHDIDSKWGHHVSAQLINNFYRGGEHGGFTGDPFLNSVTLADMKKIYPDASRTNLVKRMENARKVGLDQDTEALEAIRAYGVVKAMKNGSLKWKKGRMRFEDSSNPHLNENGPKIDKQYFEGMVENFIAIDKKLEDGRPDVIKAIAIAIERFNDNRRTNVTSGPNENDVPHTFASFIGAQRSGKLTETTDHYQMLEYGLTDLQEFTAQSYSYGTKKDSADRLNYSQLISYTSPISEETKEFYGGVFEGIMSMLKKLVNAIVGDWNVNNELWKSVALVGVVSNSSQFFSETIHSSNPTKVTLEENSYYEEIIDICG